MPERWLLPPLWFDLCWEFGGFDEYPFPLAVPSHGQTLEERAVLKQRVLPELQAASLFDGPALAPHFARVLAHIAKPGLWIEGLWMADDTNPSPARLMSVATEDSAILLVQQPGETEHFGGDIQISVHARTTIAAAAVQGLPPAKPGNRSRLAVSASVLAPKKKDGRVEDFSFMQSGGRIDRDAKALREIIETPHYRDGQFTANLRDRMGRSHRSPVLKWFDAFEPDGRYGVTQHKRSGAEAEIVVAPLGPAEIGNALENRVQEVRAMAR